jgi:hypothetical protein
MDEMGRDRAVTSRSERDYDPPMIIDLGTLVQITGSGTAMDPQMEGPPFKT